YSLLARKTKHGKTIYYVRFWLDNERIYTTPKSSGQTSKVGARRWADGCLRNGNIITKECTAFDAFAANFFTIDSEYINHLRLRRKAIEAAHLKDAQAQLDNYAIPFFRDKT